LVELEIGKKPEILLNTKEKIGKNDEIPKLSVISPSLNLAQFLEETILSVANQAFRGFEHIVIDGGSTDETLTILKRYPHIKWISEKDSGYLEAFRKGLAIARGKYVLQCCVSDGYLDRDWFKRCVEVLDADPEVSLVWGFPQYLTEDGKLGDISYPQFHHSLPPQKYDWISYWLKTNFWLPEGNFCVRREVLDKCFPAFEGFSKYRDAWLEFNYRFNSLGYLPYHIPVVANFGRTHGNQRGQNEKESGLLWIRLQAYFMKVWLCRWKLLTGHGTHFYRNGTHKALHVKFSNEKFRREHIAFIAGRAKIFAKKYFPHAFLTNVRKIYRTVKRP
jgi:glycosyltransferase involved in cell wall biosynthesis